MNETGVPKENRVLDMSRKAVNFLATNPVTQWVWNTPVARFARNPAVLGVALPWILQSLDVLPKDEAMPVAVTTALSVTAINHLFVHEPGQNEHPIGTFFMGAIKGLPSAAKAAAITWFVNTPAMDAFTSEIWGVLEHQIEEAIHIMNSPMEQAPPIPITEMPTIEPPTVLHPITPSAPTGPRISREALAHLTEFATVAGAMGGATATWLASIQILRGSIAATRIVGRWIIAVHEKMQHRR